MPKSVPYHPYKIQCLKDTRLAAAYITATLEEKDPEFDLLEAALKDVLEALAESRMSTEASKLHRKKLSDVMSKQGSDAIYSLGDWLNVLKLKLTVTVIEPAPEISENSAKIAEVTSG